jgi:beta-aspartyl-peptidase (threonine type)
MARNFVIALLITSWLMDSTVQSGESLGPNGWAIAIHTGAGSLPKVLDGKRRNSRERSLREALHTGRKILASGGSSLDAVEAVVIMRLGASQV